MAARQLTGARQKSFSGNPHSTTGLHVPAQIRRPRKVLYLIAFFGALYWFSIRHGLGQERSDTFEKDHASHLKAPAPLPGNANRKPIRIAGGIGQVGKGNGAGGIWEGALGNLGLSRVPKKKTPDHRLRKDGYVDVQITPSAEHPICESVERSFPPDLSFDMVPMYRPRCRRPDGTSSSQIRQHVVQPIPHTQRGRGRVQAEVRDPASQGVRSLVEVLRGQGYQDRR